MLRRKLCLVTNFSCRNDLFLIFWSAIYHWCITNILYLSRVDLSEDINFLHKTHDQDKGSLKSFVLNRNCFLGADHKLCMRPKGRGRVENADIGWQRGKGVRQMLTSTDREERGFWLMMISLTKWLTIAKDIGYLQTNFNILITFFKFCVFFLWFFFSFRKRVALNMLTELTQLKEGGLGTR